MEKPNDNRYFAELNLTQLKFNPFDLIKNHGMLVTAGDVRLANSMMTNWGLMGVAMNRPVMELLIHPQRYTREFLDKHSHFSVSLFKKEHRETMIYFGTHSGREHDKYVATDFHLDYYKGVPFIRESDLVFICRKLYVDRFHIEHYYDAQLRHEEEDAGEGRYRYIGEIVHTMQAKTLMGEE